MVFLKKEDAQIFVITTAQKNIKKISQKDFEKALSFSIDSAVGMNNLLIHQAVIHNNMELFIKCVENGQGWEFKNWKGKNSLDLAFEWERKDIIIFIKDTLKVDISKEMSSNGNPVWWPFLKEYKPQYEVDFLKHLNIDFNQVNEKGNNCLMWALFEYRSYDQAIHIETMNDIVRLININHKNNIGQSIVYYLEKEREGWLDNLITKANGLPVYNKVEEYKKFIRYILESADFIGKDIYGISCFEKLLRQKKFIFVKHIILNNKTFKIQNLSIEERRMFIEEFPLNIKDIEESLDTTERFYECVPLKNGFYEIVKHKPFFEEKDYKGKLVISNFELDKSQWTEINGITVIYSPEGIKDPNGVYL